MLIHHSMFSRHVLLLVKEDQITKDLQVFMERFKFKNTDQITTKIRNEINYTRGGKQLLEV